MSFSEPADLGARLYPVTLPVLPNRALVTQTQTAPGYVGPFRVGSNRTLGTVLVATPFS